LHTSTILPCGCHLIVFSDNTLCIQLISSKLLYAILSGTKALSLSM
jgi:hypothetical protein